MAVDETHLIQRKKQGGGLQGRFTPNQGTIVLGAVELESTSGGRRETGRALLKVATCFVDHSVCVNCRGE